MLPSIFGENLFDDFFDDDFFRMPAWTGRDPLYGKRGKNLMKTDVRETDTSYELDVDLPGFKKMRSTWTCKTATSPSKPPRAWTRTKRTSRAGTSVRSAMPVPAAGASTSGHPARPVSAKYEDGILKISLPKQEKRELPKQSTIAIEG